ncbi:MAG: hypothetical protein ACR2FY_06900 [Pirellulaceae bacterium]
MAAKKENPFRAGAGHSPPHLAGREEEVGKFKTHLSQQVVVKNIVLTGLRGVGKTVLMDDKFKREAISTGWAWAGSDFSEQAFLSETNLCMRLLTDLSVYSSTLSVSEPTNFGFPPSQSETTTLTFQFLFTLFEGQPGLMVDKLKAVLEFVWQAANKKGIKGIIFAYDEAQVVADQEQKEEYPLALLLEAFQSLQRKGAKYMLMLTGLPTLFPRLVESRTYAERMFSVLEIGRLPAKASREAITVPLEDCFWKFEESGIQSILKAADGYPYFIQFICREALDCLMLNPDDLSIPIEPIIRKLDSDFFAGRWETLTDRQRDLLYCIAQLDVDEGEFTIPEVVEISTKTEKKIKGFSRGDVSQMLPRLMSEKGLVYKNRHGKYSFAVPLMGKFINRKYNTPVLQKTLFE